MYIKTIEVLLHTPISLNNYQKELTAFISDTLKESTTSKIEVKIVSELSKNTEIVISLVSSTLSEFDAEFHQKYRDRVFRFLFYYFQDVEIEDFSDEVLQRVEFKSEVEKETNLYNSFDAIEEIKNSLEINLKESISDLIHKTNYSKINAHVVNRSKGDKFYNNDNNLRKVDNFLRREKRISLINGLGGVGKTTLAIEYATQALHDKIYDYAIWFNVENGIESEIKKFAITYLLDDSEDGKQEASYYERKFIDFLNKQPNSLVILDNLEYKGAYKKELESFLKKFQNIDIIITSRQEITQLDIHPIQLDVLKNENDGLEMFKLISSRNYSSSEEQTLKEIINYLGKLPLALEITANFLSEFEDMEVKEYLRKLKKEGLELFERIEDYNHLKSLRATLTINETIIKNPDALKLLKIFSLISPEPIEKEIIDKYLMEVLEISDFDKAIALKDLEKFSYIKVSADGYSMHRLLQEAIVGEFFEGNEEEQVELITAVSLGIFWWFYDAFSNYKYGSYFNKTVQHIDYILERWEKLDISKAKMYLYTCLSAYYENIGKNASIVLDYAEKSIELSNDLTISDKEKNLLYLTYAQALRINFKYDKAIEYLFESLKILTTEKEKSQVFHYLGHAYEGKGDFTNAKKYYQYVLDMSIDSTISSTLNNLAIIYEKENNYTESEKLHLKSLEIIKKNLGDFHPKIATSYNNLGYLYQQTKDYVKSFDFYYLALFTRLNLEINSDGKHWIKFYFDNFKRTRNCLPKKNRININKKIEELNNLLKEKGFKKLKLKKL